MLIDEGIIERIPERGNGRSGERTYDDERIDAELSGRSVTRRVAALLRSKTANNAELRRVLSRNRSTTSRETTRLALRRDVSSVVDGECCGDMRPLCRHCRGSDNDVATCRVTGPRFISPGRSFVRRRRRRRLSLSLRFRLRLRLRLRRVLPRYNLCFTHDAASPPPSDPRIRGRRWNGSSDAVSAVRTPAHHPSSCVSFSFVSCLAYRVAPFARAPLSTRQRQRPRPSARSVPPALSLSIDDVSGAPQSPSIALPSRCVDVSRSTMLAREQRAR